MTNAQYLPLRSFVVRVVDDKTPHVIEGHVPQVTSDGALHVLRYGGNIPWTVRIYASGYWESVTGSLPSDAEMAVIEERLTPQPSYADAGVQGQVKKQRPN